MVRYGIAYRRRYVLETKLHIKPAENTYYLMLALPSPVSRDVYEESARLLFEQFNVPALSMSEIPLMAAYAVGVLNGLMIDVGFNDTRVSAVSDCMAVPSASLVTKLGLIHCAWWLAYLLKQETDVVQAVEPVARGQLDAALWELAQDLIANKHVYVDAEAAPVVDEDEGVLDVAQALVEGREHDVVEERERQKKMPAKPAAATSTSNATSSSVVTVTFRDVAVPVGTVRTRFHEPLLRPALLDRVVLDVPMPYSVRDAQRARRIGGEPACLSISDAAAWAANNVHPMERRPALWENIIFTGEGSMIKGLPNELMQSFSSHMTTESTELSQVIGEPHPWQPHNARLLRIPDYFSAFKERMDLAPYLGATIFAKLVFGDLSGRNYITKKQYNEGGPSVAFAMGSV